MTRVLQLKTSPATCYWSSREGSGPRPVHALHLDDSINSVLVVYISYSLPADLNEPRVYQGYECMVWKPKQLDAWRLEWDTTIFEVAEEDLEGAKREAIKYAQSLGRIPTEIEVKR